MINVTNWGCKLDSKLKVGLKTSKKKKNFNLPLFFFFEEKGGQGNHRDTSS